MSLPETTEEPHFDLSSFRVRGKIFATVPQGGKQLRVFVDDLEVQALIAEDAGTYEQVVWGKRVVAGAVCIHLPTAEPAVVRELLEAAWRRRAPKRLIAALDTSRRANGE